MTALFLAASSAASLATATDTPVPRINQLQYIGSHNSYHAGLASGQAALWQRYHLQTLANVHYSHPSLLQGQQPA